MLLMHSQVLNRSSLKLLNLFNYGYCMLCVMYLFINYFNAIFIYSMKNKVFPISKYFITYKLHTFKLSCIFEI